MRLNRREIVEREYATTERAAFRRLDRTALLRGEEPWHVALTAIAEAKPTRVLDAGCGAGDFALLITAPELVCVDASPAMVDHARERGLDARVADIGSLPFADGEFDVAVCNWVLYHVEHLDRGLAELARVLRRGGRFVGIYNARDHLHDLWESINAPWDELEGEFGCEDGVGVLAHQFAHVERRDTHGEVVWETREALQVYLDAFRELYGPLSAPEESYPFRALRHNCVFVAEKAR